MPGWDTTPPHRTADSGLCIVAGLRHLAAVCSGSFSDVDGGGFRFWNS